MDSERDLFLVAYADGEVVGSVIIDQSGGGPQGAHLRWFIVGEEMQGKGLGPTFSAAPCSFCDERGYERIWLTTFAGLDAARGLYERHGFVLTGEAETDQWSGDVREQIFERRMPALPVDYGDAARTAEARASSPGGWSRLSSSPRQPPPPSSPAISIARSSPPSPRASASPSSSPSSASRWPRRSASASR